MALNVHMPKEFWDSSSNMYHGVDPANINSIVQNGFRPAQCQHRGKAAYLTPSIRYAAHPRYARVCKRGGLYYQFVLQVRVRSDAITHWKDAVVAKRESQLIFQQRRGEEAVAGEYIDTESETMCVGDIEKIDDNFSDNNNMEFLYFSEKPYVTPSDGLVVTGIMVRCLSSDPIGAKENTWWLYWASVVGGAGKDPSAFLRRLYSKTVS